MSTDLDESGVVERDRATLDHADSRESPVRDRVHIRRPAVGIVFPAEIIVASCTIALIAYHLHRREHTGATPG